MYEYQLDSQKINIWVDCGDRLARKKETDLQEKKSHNSFKVGPTNGNNTYDELQELATRQSYSGHIFL